MMQTEFIRPAPGHTILAPDGSYVLPEAGMDVRWCSYWERRRREGSILMGPVPAADPDVQPKRAKSTEHTT